jgi:hypothetical protein
MNIEQLVTPTWRDQMDKRNEGENLNSHNMILIVTRQELNQWMFILYFIKKIANNFPTVFSKIFLEFQQEGVTVTAYST